jgi:putative transposase
LNEFVAHYHEERNHQGKGNVLLFPSAKPSLLAWSDAIECKQRVGGMLKYSCSG